jgi:hypothetical protein
MMLPWMLLLCQWDADGNVARLHFLRRSCCIAAADAGQGINRARRPRSFIVVVGVRGLAEARLDVQNVSQVLSGWV